MKQDTHKTKVIFKREQNGDICAFFPEITGTRDPYTCTYYAHIGQHSSADVGCAAALPRAKEFSALKKELENLGYNVQVARKFTQAALAKRKEMCR